ncbi:site-specific DNA-methyltransferase [Burkholderia sp. LMG 13014]|uniref:DNA-methyltransferase n=1 Tax=Burkholderia sp. LMG 13014 TaxID=2709306 RepID=UPI001962D7D3|nr:site-specific DNA-methyltransferase [Burkholderia sp. LMG 13014]
MNWIDRSHRGDCRDLMRAMIADGVRVQTIVTSPPYWGLRSYLPAGHPDKHREIGQEPTLREFIDTMVGVFDLARELLADDGSGTKNNGSFDEAMAIMPTERNRRSVWTIPTQSYSGAHFATFPEALVEPCVLAGSRPGDVVFDPFFGSGTTCQVAQRLGRRFLGCELNPEYEPLQCNRLRQPSLMLEAS